ncbi:MAG: phage tail tape measure protein [Bacteroidales bacterium]|nr:phage tail tape measure protein [Bacteroidales bacterium]
MSLKVDRVELEIVIKNDENRKRLREIEDDMRRVQKELKKAKEGTVEWANADKKLKDLKLAHDAIYDKIGLTNLSLKELNRRQQELTSILSHVPGDSPLYKKYKDQLDEVKSRIRDLKGTAQETHFSLGRMADGFNRYFTMITAFAASITGLVMGFRSLKEERDKLEDSKANLKALTGLGQEDVDQLTEMAKVLSVNPIEGAGIRIRQSAQEIVDAYTLVGSAKPELLKDADALNNVTKQALILATASKTDLKDAVAGLTNTMNQFNAGAEKANHYMNVLAAGSQAGAKEVPYISEAMTKFGAVSKMANVNVEQSVALIETLGEKGHAAEIAGTGLKTFFVRLMNGADSTNPKIVGMSTALDNLSEKFSGKGGFSKMVKLFGQDNVVIAQTLIENRKRFEELTDAVTGTSTGMEQAAINSQTPAAVMAQSINKMKIAGVELVDKLQPAMMLMTGWFSKTVQALPGVVDWFGKWGGVIVKTTIVIGAYVVATKLQNFWANRNIETSLLNIATTKLKIFWDNAAIAATTLHAAAIFLLNGNLKMANQTMRLFFATIGLNPISLLTAGIIAAGMALYYFASKSNEAQSKVKSLMEIQKEAAKQTASQKTELELLLEIARSNNYSLDERRKAMARINEISPKYLGNITLETLGKRESIKAIDDYILALDREAIAKASQDKMTEVRAQQMENNLNIKELQDYQSKTVIGSDSYRIYEGKISDLEKENKQLEIKAGFLKEIYKESTVTVTPVKSEQTIKDELRARKAVLDKELAENKISSDEYHRKMILAEKKYQEELESFKQEERKKADAKKQQQAKLDLLNAQFKKEKEAIEKDHTSKLITENEYQKKMDDLIKSYQQKKSVIFSPKEEGKKNNSNSNSNSDTPDSAAKKALDNALKDKEDAWKTAIAKETSAYNALAKSKKEIEDLSETDLENYLKKREEQTEAHNDKLDSIELNYLRERKSVLLKNKQDVGEIDAQIATKQAQMNDKALKQAVDHQKKMTDEQKKEAEKQLKILDTLEAAEKAQLDEKKAKGLLSESEYQTALLKLEANFLIKKMALAGISAEKLEELKKQFIEVASKGSELNAKDRQAFDDKYSSEQSKLIAWKKKETDILKDYLNRGIITEKEAKEAQALLDKEYNLKKLENYSKAAQEIANVAGNLANAAQGFQQAEERSVENKYAKLIKAAGKNSSQITKLEEKKEQELAAVKKKWADKQFVLTVAQVIAQTAVAAISAYASAVKVPIIGPTIAPIAAAAAIAAGAAQLAVANQARQQAKDGLYEGGYSNDYVEGYTRRGNSRDEAGVIPVHSNEFVGNNEGVANPHVNQFYEIFNSAQQRGRIRMMNTTDILQQIRVKGLYDGGYSQPNANRNNQGSQSTSVSLADLNGIAAVLSRNADVMERLDAKMSKPFVGKVAITGQDGIKEQMALYDRMMAAKNRG